MKIYLASPLFNGKQKTRIQEVVSYLRKKGNDVFSPMEFEVEDAWGISNKEWAKQVFDHDVKGLEESDVVVAIYEGMNSDTGTCWEIGYAAAKGKDIIVLSTDLSVDHSLMVVGSCFGVYSYEHYSTAWENYLSVRETGKAVGSDEIAEIPFIPSIVYQS